MGLSGVVGGSTARRSRLGDRVSDRPAVLQRVTEVDHLVAVVLIASVGGARRRREAIALLPQAQRVRADVEHRGGFVDRERGSTLLLNLYRQPDSIPLALSTIADRSRMDAVRRRGRQVTELSQTCAQTTRHTRVDQPRSGAPRAALTEPRPNFVVCIRTDGSLAPLAPRPASGDPQALPAPHSATAPAARVGPARKQVQVSKRIALSRALPCGGMI
jgi:hypothetical protein